MDDIFEFRAFLVCDDVRREISGKEILIGVYGDGLVVPSFPATIRNLVFRVTGVVRLESAGDLVFRLEDQDGKAKGEARGSVPAATTPRFVSFNFAFENTTFEEEVVLTAMFGFGDRIRKVGTFSIKLPSNEQERVRASVSA